MARRQPTGVREQYCLVSSNWVSGMEGREEGGGRREGGGGKGVERREGEKERMRKSAMNSSHECITYMYIICTQTFISWLTGFATSITPCRVLTPYTAGMNLCPLHCW